MYCQSGLDSSELTEKERTECLTILSKVYNKFYIIYALQSEIERSLLYNEKDIDVRT